MHGFRTEKAQGMKERRKDVLYIREMEKRTYDMVHLKELIVRA